MFDWMSTQGDSPLMAQAVTLENTGIVTMGIVAGTRVASNLGWRAVEALAPGDKVLTFDNGMQPIVEVKREICRVDPRDVPMGHWPLRVPAGVLSNRAELLLMADQGVLIESDVADEALDDPFAVIRARALDGVCGIERMRPDVQLEIITLVLAGEQVIYAEGGALLHCAPVGDLFHGEVNGTGYTFLEHDLLALAVDELRTEAALRRGQADAHSHAA